MESKRSGEAQETLDDVYRFAVEQSTLSRGQFMELTVVLILILEAGLGLPWSNEAAANLTMRPGAVSPEFAVTSTKNKRKVASTLS